jgi:ABC-type uncharacterized transport system ATPase subunit
VRTKPKFKLPTEATRPNPKPRQVVVPRTIDTKEIAAMQNLREKMETYAGLLKLVPHNHDECRRIMKDTVVATVAYLTSFEKVTATFIPVMDGGDTNEAADAKASE